MKPRIEVIFFLARASDTTDLDEEVYHAKLSTNLSKIDLTLAWA